MLWNLLLPFLALVGPSSVEAQDEHLPGTNCYATEIPGPGVPVPPCPPPAGEVADVDVDGDGTNESHTTGVSISGGGGVTVELICVNRSYFAVKITKPGGVVEYGGGCGYLHGGNKASMIYCDTDGSGAFTPGVDEILQIKYWNMKAIGINCDIPDGEARYFTYYVSSGSVNRVYYVQDASGKWVIDEGEWPPDNFPAPRGPISPGDLSGVLFSISSMPPDSHCVDGLGMRNFVVTEPTAFISTVNAGGSVTVTGHVVGVAGFSQSLTVRLAIRPPGSGAVAALDQFTIDPPYPVTYQRTIPIPASTPAGPYRLIAWAQTSDAAGFASSNTIALTVTPAPVTVPGIGVVAGTLLVIVMLGLGTLVLWMQRLPAG